MSTENDFIENIRGLMYSEAVGIYLESIGPKLKPFAEGEVRVGTLSDDKVRLWVLWEMAREDLDMKSHSLMSRASDLELELRRSEERFTEAVRTKYKPIMDEAQAQCTKAISHELGIRCMLFGVLALEYGINPAGGDEVYDVRMGFELVRVPAENYDSEVIRKASDRLLVITMLGAFGRRS